MKKRLTFWAIKLVAWLAILATCLWAGERLIRHWEGAWLGYFLVLVLIILATIAAWLGSIYLAGELDEIVSN